MGDKTTLRLARQELEDLYRGVPDDSVDLTFKDFAFKPAAARPAAAASAFPAATTTSSLPNNAAAAVHVISVDEADDEREKKQTTTTTTGALVRSPTNIFTYRPLEADHKDAVVGGGLAGASGGDGGLLQLPPPPPASLPTVRLALGMDADEDDDDDVYYSGHRQYQYPAPPAAGTTSGSSRPDAAAAAGNEAASGRRSRRLHAADDAIGGVRERCAAHGNNYRRPGIPHSNICALCNSYVYVFRHRCLVCGRVYCRRCVGAGMGDMTEGRKCVDCLGRRYSHRYIHRAGDTGCGFCCWGYYPNAKAVTAQELIWAEKGPAPRRRPRPNGSSSISTSYGGGDGGYYSSTNTIASASMSMTMNSDSSISMMRMNGGHGRNHHASNGMPGSASSSFVAAFPHNPHALPL